MDDIELVIKIDKDVFTRLFDNGTEDYGIANDDLFDIARAIRKGTPLNEVLDKISAEIEKVETYDGLYIDRAYVLQIIDKYKESEE